MAAFGKSGRCDKAGVQRVLGPLPCSVDANGASRSSNRRFARCIEDPNGLLTGKMGGSADSVGQAHYERVSDGDGKEGKNYKLAENPTMEASFPDT